MLGQRVLPDAERQLALELGSAAVEHQPSARAASSLSSSSSRVLPIPPSPENAITAPWRRASCARASSNAASSARRPRIDPLSAATRQSNRGGGIRRRSCA